MAHRVTMSHKGTTVYQNDFDVEADAMATASSLAAGAGVLSSTGTEWTCENKTTVKVSIAESV